MLLEKVNVKGHQFEVDINGVFVCELCQKWFCPEDEPESDVQKKIDGLGDCPGL